VSKVVAHGSTIHTRTGGADFANRNYNGTRAEQLVKQTVLRMVEEDAAFRAGVQRGIEQANRGEFIAHDEVKAPIEFLLRPR
jgi:predicted transcriptional regulator